MSGMWEQVRDRGGFDDPAAEDAGYQGRHRLVAGDEEQHRAMAAGAAADRGEDVGPDGE